MGLQCLAFNFIFNRVPAAELALITPVIVTPWRSSCEDNHDYCENSFWDLQSIVAVHNDTAVACA